MTRVILIPLMTAALALTACEGFDGMGNKQMIGAGTGAVLGGFAGSKVGKGSGQLVATGVGTLLGLAVGSSIGQSLDKVDMMYAQQAEQKAYSAPVGKTITWNNPESGRSGSVTPTRDGKMSDGRTCREYKTTIYIDGQAQSGVGTACRNFDGTWEVVK